MTRNTQQRGRQRDADREGTESTEGTDGIGGTNRTDSIDSTDLPARGEADETLGAGTTPGADAGVLTLDGVGKSYGAETALSELSLSVAEGEILALLGPSGCGKTTTLRLLAGLESPDTGQLRLHGEEIASAEASESRPPEAFGLSDLEDADREARVAELLELVDLAGRGEAYPDTLSGGQKQRVALARSLAPEPDVLLLDEPLSNLDVRLRVSMREEVHRILAEAGVTAIWVTHDQEEALSIADRVGIMSEGRLHQIGSPEKVFERPATRFVASFLGQAGFLAGRVEGDRLTTDIGPIGREVLDDHGDRDGREEGEAVDVLVRPDDLRVTPATDGHAHGRIVRQQYRGPSFIYRVETTGGDVLHCLHNHTESFDVGRSVRIELVAGHQLAWYPREEGSRDGTRDRGIEAEVETDASATLDR
ncbi:ABC transporter ATP-binding protein [Halobacteriales archaeon QS_3_64_16]|nr:MAG: ABC transporter ATP-binding protein [Halobacteriales archaeon QS_3_64_16]